MRNEERIPYIKTLMYIALADDTIEESEMQYFEQIANIYGLNDDEISNSIRFSFSKYIDVEDLNVIDNL